MTLNIIEDKISLPVYSNAIRTYIVDNLLLGDNNGITDHDSLHDSGVLDSTAVMELIAFLESHFNIDIDDKDLTESNLGSIARIARFVEQKMAAPHRSDKQA